MKILKRLFLFAGYDKDNIIDDTLVWYLSSLSEFGDIILFMDNNIKDISKLKKIKNILYFETKHHGEYDFGSYKRAYMWARDKKILDKYEWVYLVNDSVYGPLFNLEPCLRNLESSNADFTGLTSYVDNCVPKHIQSYFVGLSKKVAISDILYEFMKNVTHRDNKKEIIYKYEVGLSRTLLQNGFSLYAIIDQNSENNIVENHFVYEKPKKILDNFIPFIKKAALIKFDSFLSLLPYTSEKNIKNIYAHANRTYIDKAPQQDIVLEPKINPIYEKYYRFTFFSIPIYTIYRKCCGGISYKVCIFDKIPIAKIYKSS